MTHREIQRRVTDCIWSETVKREIARQGIVYTPLQLLQIAFRAETDFERRQALYALLAEQLPEIAAEAARVGAAEREQLTRFCAADPTVVYEVEAVSGPDSEAPERVLCVSWEDALKAAALYREAHWMEACGQSVRRLRYTVTLRRIWRASAPDEPSELAWCTLDSELRVQAVRWRLEDRSGIDCTDDCEDCRRLCIFRETAAYPLCIPAWGFVRYRWNGWEKYAVNWLTGCENAMEPDTALIPLDAAHMCDRDVEGGYGHIHAALTEIEPITAAELPDETRDAAEEYRAWLEANLS